MVRNCVTLNSTGQILRIGYSDFENDGSFNMATETFHADVLTLVPGILITFQKIVGNNPGVPTEMTQLEKDAVTIVDAATIKYLPLLFPLEPPESLSNDLDVISILTYVSILSGNNVSMSLPDGDTSLQTKKLQVQGNADVDITISLVSPFTKINMGNNSKADLFYRKDMKNTAGNFGVWCFLDHKNISFIQ